MIKITSFDVYTRPSVIINIHTAVFEYFSLCKHKIILNAAFNGVEFFSEVLPVYNYS